MKSTSWSSVRSPVHIVVSAIADSKEVLVGAYKERVSGLTGNSHVGKLDVRQLRERLDLLRAQVVRELQRWRCSHRYSTDWLGCLKHPDFL
jgi:hypothetical protein